MFGYIMTNRKALSEADRKRYGDLYCGVCRSLSGRYGMSAKFTLNYDIAFLALVLCDVCNDVPQTVNKCCVTHPFTSRSYSASAITDYAADMNVILAYYNLLDNADDDNSLLAGMYAGILGKHFKKACARNPEKSVSIKRLMQELSALEKSGTSNPDTVSSRFSEVLGEVFAYGDKADELRAFGKALGKFIYILDACIDLKADLKAKRYNPFTFAAHIDEKPMLESLMADCGKCLDKLPEAAGDTIVQNIIYSGVWTKYDIAKARNK